VDEPTKTVRVSVRRLHDALEELDVSKVDFIKMDAEGAVGASHGEMSQKRQE